MEPITQLPEIIGGIGGTYKDYDGTMKTIPSNSVIKLSTYVSFQWLQKDLKYRIDKCTADSGPVNTVSVKLVENGCPRFGWVSVTKKYDGVSFPIFSFIKGNVPQTDFHLVCELLICGVESDDLCQDNITCDKNKAKGCTIS